MLGIGLPLAAQCSDTLEPTITHNEILECDTISIFIRVDSGILGGSVFQSALQTSF